MFRNYFKAAIRNSIRYRSQALISVGGLAIGLACCILMMLWVVDELSYDTFHTNFDSLYRVTEQWQHGDESYSSALVSVPLVMTIKEEVPEISRAARCYIAGPQVVEHGDVRFESDVLAYADPDLLEMFTFPLVRGDKGQVLAQASSVVITEAMSDRHFGDEDPVGQAIEIDRRDFVVTGVLKDIPRNSHLQFDCLTSFDSRPEYLKAITDDNWGVSAFYAYVQLHPDAVVSEAVDKIDAIQVAHMTESEGTHNSDLQPIGRIHLYHDVEDFLQGHGEIKYVYLFSVLAVLTLIIACINFMNLSTARAGRRSREVGMRKVIGARRSDLVYQFFGESMLAVAAALALALVLVELFLPVLNTWSGKELSLLSSASLTGVLGLVAIGLLTGLLAGSYPAVILSSFIPSKVLKGQLQGGQTGRLFRRILVTVQFTLSIGLLIATAVIYSQLDFIKTKPLGFDKERLIYFTMRGDFVPNYEVIKSELLQHPAIEAVALGTPPVRNLGPLFDADWEGRSEEADLRWSSLAVDADYLGTLGMKIVEGRGYSQELAQTASQGFIVNRAAAAALGSGSPIGKRFRFSTHSLIGHLEHVSYEGSIVGVVDDFHHGSLHDRIAPIVIYLDPEQCRHVCVKVAEGHESDAVGLIREHWDRFCPDYLFQYQFVDQAIDRFYRFEHRLSVILYSFTILAIFVTCLGLIGLASFVTEHRAKEIGVRKILGATIAGLVSLLSKEFVAMVIVAGLIAGPIAGWVMSHWLQSFAYRTEIGWFLPVVATMSALLMALVTVSSHTIRAARANPVHALRDE